MSIFPRLDQKNLEKIKDLLQPSNKIEDKEPIEKFKKKFRNLYRTKDDKKDYLNNFYEVYPYLCDLVLDQNGLFKDPVKILAQKENIKQELTRKQVACIFFLSLLGCINNEYNRKLNGFQVYNILSSAYGTELEFAKCFLNYLTNIGRWIKEKNPILDEKITYMRNHIENKDFEKILLEPPINLCEIKIETEGSMYESDATYIVDFANKYIGGGTLHGGCVQEEILFAIQPELVVSMGFMEVMDKNDAIRMDNTIKYSNHSGYAHTFKFKDNAIKDTSFKNKKEPPRIIAMDAVVNGSVNQFDKELIRRDIVKAYVCFNLINVDQNDSSEKIIATGNWGCGAFDGDHELKFIQQWIAASFAGVKILKYYTFGDKNMDIVTKYFTEIKKIYSSAQELCKNLLDLSSILRKKNVLSILLKYKPKEENNTKKP